MATIDDPFDSGRSYGSQGGDEDFFSAQERASQAAARETPGQHSALPSMPQLAACVSRVQAQVAGDDAPMQRKREFQIPELKAVYERVNPIGTTVCVTGASGFIASHIIELLLSKGYRVRGTCRESTLKNPAKIAHLKKFENADLNLELVEANLNQPTSFDKAIAGCLFVIHCASPYDLLDIKEPNSQIINPAVNGTLGVLQAAKRHRVQRVIMTSCLQAMFDTPEEDHIYSEDDWNSKSSPEHNPYHYSKTEAESLAWKYAGANELDLVVLNPALTLGPSHSGRLNESAKALIAILGGVYPAIMQVSYPLIDVRDVARCHVLAIETPQLKGRYLLSGGVMDMKQIITSVEDRFPNYPYPEAQLLNRFGTMLASAQTYLFPGYLGQFFRTYVGASINLDTSKATRAFGPFTNLGACLTDCIEDLIKWGHIADMLPSHIAYDEMLELRKKMEDPQEGVGIKPRTFFTITYPDCFVGDRAASWIKNYLKLNHRSKAVRILEAMYKAGLFVNVVEGKEVGYQDRVEWYRFVDDSAGAAGGYDSDDNDAL